jgi:hypothetical protein
VKVTFEAKELFRPRRPPRKPAQATPAAKPAPQTPAGPPPVPRLARQLALAYHVERLVEAGRLACYAEAARLLGVSRARMTQVMDLLGLEPAEKQRILAGEATGSERARRGCQQLGIDHHRVRKTGPRHLLAVVVCGTHGCGFTLYPPGYAPYRRQPVLHVAPDGSPVPGDGDHERFAETMFEAAVDAKAGRAWARLTEDDPPEHWWSTQGRHLGFAARLVGVAANLADAARETIATALSVSTLMLREHSLARGYRAIGDAICDVLQRIRGGTRRAQQLLVCGHLAGHWGAPWRWDPSRQVMERSPFLRRDLWSRPQ